MAGKSPRRGEIWLVDLGLAAKTRPCLLLTDYPADDELALVTIIAHTTSLRGNRWELEVKKPFLRKGAFHLQQIQSIPMAALLHRLGSINADEMAEIEAAIKNRLGI